MVSNATVAARHGFPCNLLGATAVMTRGSKDAKEKAMTEERGIGMEYNNRNFRSQRITYHLLYDVTQDG